MVEFCPIETISEQRANGHYLPRLRQVLRIKFPLMHVPSEKVQGTSMPAQHRDLRSPLALHGSKQPVQTLWEISMPSV